MTLSVYKGKHDALPWIEYFISTVLAAYKEFGSRFKKASSGSGSKTNIVLNAIDSFIGDFSISEIEKACPTVSRDMLRHILFKLWEQGKIQPTRKGRSARWRKIV